MMNFKTSKKEQDLVLLFVIKRELEGYISAYTVGGRYVGIPDIIVSYDMLIKHLKAESLRIKGASTQEGVHPH